MWSGLVAIVHYSPGMGLDGRQIDHEPDRLSLGNGGWVRASYMDDQLHAYARFANVGGRLELVEQYLRRPDGGPLRSPERAAVQWGRLATIVNLPRIRPRVEFLLQLPGPDLARAAAAFRTTYGAKADHWLANMLHAQIQGGAPQAPWPDPGRARAPVPGGGPARERDTLDPRAAALPTGALEVPTNRPYPVSFYEHVAQAYEELKGAGVAPNSAMAAANKVPKTTADRWVREARRRGLLGTAPRGNPITRW